MDFQSKFSLKEKVYFMHNNRVAKGTIHLISFTTWLVNRNIERTSFQYKVKSTEGVENFYCEPLLFKTKADLLKTL